MVARSAKTFQMLLHGPDIQTGQTRCDLWVEVDNPRAASMSLGMRQLAKTGLCAGLLALAACANQTQEVGGKVVVGAVSRIQCADFDWYRVGLHDGGKGAEQPTRFTFLDNSCSSHGYKAEREAYFEGYAEGQRRAAQ